MQKCLIFLTLLFSMSLWASPDWNPYYMNHERFVHLSAQEKEQVVVKTMEMIVEMEGKYRKAVVNHESSKEILQKYTHLLKTLNSLLISDAYADEIDPAFHKLAKDFSSLLSELKTDGCIYAGYVSVLVNGRCSSPNLLSPNSKNAAIIKKIKAAYLTKTSQANTKCGGTKKISCNPVVFGYQKNSSKVPFCVNTSPDESHNAAYECMKLALNEKGSAGTDSKEVRLNYLTAAMSDKTTASAFNEAHKFIYRTCVCGDTELNSAYKEYMKPHRTCFGMLNTLREIKSQECAPLQTEAFKSSFGDQWMNYFGSSSFKKQDSTKNVVFDDNYGQLLSSNSLKTMCGIEDDKPERDPATENGEVCEAPCKIEKDGDKEVVICTISKITITKEGNQTVLTEKDFETAKLPLEAGKKELTFKSKSGTEHVCKVEDPRDDDKDKGALSCTLSKSGDDSKNPVIVLTFNNLKEGQDIPKITWKGAQGEVDKDDQTKFNAIATDKVQKLVATFVPPASENATPKTSSATAKAAAAAVGSASPGSATAVEAAVNAAEAAVANSCPFDVVDDKSGKTYTIKTTPSPDGPVTVKVDAEVTVTGGDTKLPAEYQIVWIRKGFKGPKAEEKKEKKDEPTKKMGDSKPEPTTTTTKVEKTEEELKKEEEEKKKAEADKEANAPFAEGEKGSSTASVTETKYTEKYDTCAQLLDEKQNKVADSCSEIPPVSLPQNPGGGANRPPQFLSPSYNTRTMGIQ